MQSNPSSSKHFRQQFEGERLGLSAKVAIDTINANPSSLRSSGLNLEQIFINNTEIEKILSRYQNLCSEMDQEVANLTNVNTNRLNDSYSIIPELDP